MEIVGVAASGKTTLALHAVAEAQKKGGIAAFIDAEHALDPGYARKLGVKVEVTDEIAAGVVSLPHGWGHDAPDTRMRIAAERPGTNSNLLTDELALDPISGTAVLNGIPVEVEPLGDG